ncbi:two-component system sensor kinase [Salmonella enterica subsp. arizonae]|uniref:Two-component system sensor kinase n=1 Tax=Salmonella enterica subsp. arizonae TaxID=59203 RepID=A0A379TBC4_SALER|nr:two-component system sensor kinase [Salmonella enterica subsp. arizonae]
MLPHDQHTQIEERLLDDVSVMVDVTSNEVRAIVLRQLENWGRDLHHTG